MKKFTTEDLHFRISDHVSLVPVAEAFAEAEFALVDHHREYMRRWLPWVDGLTSVEQSRENILQSQKGMAEWTTIELSIQVDGKPAGRLGLHGINWDQQRTSIGYWIGEPYQGQGTMTACCRVFFHFLFTELGLHRLELRCAAENKASNAVARHLGFQLEGVTRAGEKLNGEFIDGNVYSLLSTDEAATQLLG